MSESHEVNYPEEALEPDLRIIDAHHHLFPQGHYTRIDLDRDLHAGHNIVATVFIDCMQKYRPDGPEHLRPVGEVEWVLTERDGSGVAEGIISFADMYLGSLAGETLAAQIALAGSAFKGIRHSVAWDPSPDVNNALRDAPDHALLDPKFQEGVAQLDKADLIFETWLYPRQLGEIDELAHAFPNLRIIINHLAGPVVIGPYAGHREEMLETWREGLELVARNENVFFKLGGIGYKSFVEESVMAGPRTSEWLADYWRPELLFAIETFGPDHCMFESNYPADAPLCDYITLWNTFKRATADLDASDRAQIFEGTARSVYRL